MVLYYRLATYYLNIIHTYTHHNRENEVGPFYGVHYDGGNYTWYSEQELIKLQNNK